MGAVSWIATGTSSVWSAGGRCPLGDWSMRADSSAMVGALNISSTGTSLPSRLRISADTCTASSEWPPRSKKRS